MRPHFMQAITTKFHGPTDTRGSRYSARCEAGRISIQADDRLDYTANHALAAQALIRKLGWFNDAARGDRYGRWYGGATADGYVFVCAVEGSEVRQ